MASPGERQGVPGLWAGTWRRASKKLVDAKSRQQENSAKNAENKAETKGKRAGVFAEAFRIVVVHWNHPDRLRQTSILDSRPHASIQQSSGCIPRMLPARSSTSNPVGRGAASKSSRAFPWTWLMRQMRIDVWRSSDRNDER